VLSCCVELFFSNPRASSWHEPNSPITIVHGGIAFSHGRQAAYRSRRSAGKRRSFVRVTPSVDSEAPRPACHTRIVNRSSRPPTFQTRKYPLTRLVPPTILRQPGSSCLRRILRIGFAPLESRKTSMVAHLRIVSKDENPEPARRSDSCLRKFAKALYYCRASWRIQPSDCSIAPFVMDQELDRLNDAPPLLRLFVGKASGPSITGWGDRTVPFFRLWNGGRDASDSAGSTAADDTPAPANEEPPRRLRLVRHQAHPNVGRKTCHKSKDRVSGR
jgi:hypothetical protein